jgi:formate hydrogenlyase subunit 4
MLSKLAIKILSLSLYLIAGPFLAGILNGIDRRLTARMQGRVGPPLLQPFYDVAKLWQRDSRHQHSQDFLVLIYLIFQFLPAHLLPLHDLLLGSLR